MRTFEDLLEFFSDEVVAFGRFTKGALLGQDARKFIGPEVLRDPPTATAEALEFLSHFVAERNGGPGASIRDEGASSRLFRGGLVNILFGCLPDPEAFERSKNGLEGIEELQLIYDGFKEFIEYLFTVIGRKEMENMCADPLLGRLFLTVDRAVASGQTRPLHVWKDELRRLAWDTRVNAQASTHKPLTVHILKYLRWEVQGRKDRFRTVEKPWLPVDHEKPRRTPRQELAQLSHAEICRDMRDMCRLALFFQITFVRYLLSVMSGTTFVVSEDDGVVKCFLSNKKWLDSDDESNYVGISPDLELSLPKVKTALHGFHCCDIKQKALALLEYFFDRRPFTSIEFLSFVPKNALTPLELVENGWFRFNMSALHTVAVLTTRSGRQFILDPTAAQFGWKEFLVAWETYAQSRVDLESSRKECSFPHRPRTPTKYTKRPEDTAGRNLWTSRVVVEDVLEITKANFNQNGGLDDILQLPEAQFREQCSKLKESLRSEMPVRDRSRLSSQE